MRSTKAAPASGLQTEFEFILPRGYVDREGRLHKNGRMRLATAMDEIAPLRDPRVRSNQAYLVIILLARVITRLGSIDNVDTNMVENLFSSDLAFLQDFYRRINDPAATDEEGGADDEADGEDADPLG